MKIKDEKTSMSPLLITTAIQPPDNSYSLRMNNTEKRMALTKASIYFWAGYGIRNMVIADATETIVLNTQELKSLSAMGIKVEQINYRQDRALIVQKGKGYGEGALIDFAVKNSYLLKDTNHFYKCTGKIFCRNFNEINTAIEKDDIKNIFWRDPLNEWIDTRFFHVSKSFCTKFLIPAYQTIEDRKGLWAERVVFELAQQSLTLINGVRPLLTGFSGTLDKPHFDASLGFLDSNFPSWVS